MLQAKIYWYKRIKTGFEKVTDINKSTHYSFESVDIKDIKRHETMN